MKSLEWFLAKAKVFRVYHPLLLNRLEYLILLRIEKRSRCQNDCKTSLDLFSKDVELLLSKGCIRAVVTHN